MRNTPSHKPTIHLPDGSVRVIVENQPISECKESFRCKYCYTIHDDWWNMDPVEYGEDGVILCGKCEHTSMKEFASIAGEFTPGDSELTPDDSRG